MDTWLAFIWWLRDHGLSWFGYKETKFAGRCLVVYRWGLFLPGRWEVWYPGLHSTMTKNLDSKDKYFEPLPEGSAERYHRLELSADRIYAGPDIYEAMNVGLKKTRDAEAALTSGTAL